MLRLYLFKLGRYRATLLAASATLHPSARNPTRPSPTDREAS